MMTPQEVGSRSFSRATLGGYNMAMVDEFLETLTEDYTALYNDNAILKGKLKVLSDTLEEYRVTDNAMRKALLAAQKMADEMVSDAEQKKDQLVQEAEQAAASRIASLQEEIAAEESRLRQAQEATASYLHKLSELHEQQMDFLSQLSHMTPSEAASQSAPADQMVDADVPQNPTPSPVVSAPDLASSTRSLFENLQAGEGLSKTDDEATKRFENLQFGKDYKIQ